MECREPAPSQSGISSAVVPYKDLNEAIATTIDDGRFITVVPVGDDCFSIHYFEESPFSQLMEVLNADTEETVQ